MCVCVHVQSKNLSQLCKGHFNTIHFALWCFSLQLCDQDEAVGEPTAAEGQAAVRYEYHVLYSCSYQIPVLYFRASTLGTWT